MSTFVPLKVQIQTGVTIVEFGGWLSWVIRLNPLTYGVAGLRRIMTSNAAAVEGLPAWSVCLSVTILSATAYMMIAIWITNRPTVHNAR